MKKIIWTFYVVKVYRGRYSVGINARFTIAKRSYEIPNIWRWILQIFSNILPTTTTTTTYFYHIFYYNCPFFKNCWGVHWLYKYWSTSFATIFQATYYPVINSLISKVPVELRGNLSQHICLTSTKIYMNRHTSQTFTHQLWNIYVSIFKKNGHIITVWYNFSAN